MTAMGDTVSTKAYLEVEETKRLEEAASNPRDRLLIRLYRRLGCRVSEALGLDVTNIDFARHEVTIQHLKARTKLSCPDCGEHLGKKSVFCPKCGATVQKAVAHALETKRMRTLPVDDDTMKMLRAYIKTLGPAPSNGRQLLFPFSRQWARQIVVTCARRAGLPKLRNPSTGRTHQVTPHRLRDSFAVHAVDADGTLDGVRLLQEQLGHQDINTTMKYRKVSGKELKAWNERLLKGGA